MGVYLHVGGVASTLLPVDVQPELLAHLADLGSVLSEEGSRGLVPLPLLHVSRQVVQQLCEQSGTSVHVSSPPLIDATGA